MKNLTLIILLVCCYSFSKTTSRESKTVQCYDIFSAKNNYSDNGIGVDLVFKKDNVEVKIFKRGFAKELVRSLMVKEISGNKSGMERFAFQGSDFLLVLEKDKVKNGKKIYQGLLKVKVDKIVKFASKPKGTKEISEPMFCEMNQ